MEIEPDPSDVAAGDTSRHERRLAQIKNILRSAVESKDAPDIWAAASVGFAVTVPALPELLDIPTKPELAEPTPPTYFEFRPEPQRSDPKYNAGSFLEKAFGSDYEAWAYDGERVHDENQRRHDEYVAAVAAWTSRHTESQQTPAVKPPFDDAEPPPPNYLEFLPEPQRSDPKYWSAGEKVFLQDHMKWSNHVKQAKAENQRRYDEHMVAVKRWNWQSVEHECALAAWADKARKIGVENQARKDNHAAAMERWRAELARFEESIALVRHSYEARESEAIKHCCKLVLQCSSLPDGFRRDVDVEYIPETRILIVDHALPAPDDLNRVKEVRFVESRHEFVEVCLSEREFDEIYDEALYQTCLRTIHELFHADAINALSAVVFNGWIESVDRATGNETKGCVMSVQAIKETFLKINLARVDPKACFKALKGIGSSTLHSLTPIAPVLKINREDKRFVPSHEVAGQLDERTNLAAMDWEEFEHLIRELFEKEFCKPGCEVKVTQASRDGGVDSVVFDPDPIHGGKTVIQAKRYTNTVGVAAVRELYGTVLNEGAMKGILVTTADYGPDAYEFAAGKPLVLLNGANLLHLLEKHGHKAKIDIKEAKRILGEKVQ